MTAFDSKDTKLSTEDVRLFWLFPVSRYHVAFDSVTMFCFVLKQVNSDKYFF